jgi:hypothetical protein
VSAAQTPWAAVPGSYALDALLHRKYTFAPIFDPCVGEATIAGKRLS